jgi:hypothetical protein
MLSSDIFEFLIQNIQHIAGDADEAVRAAAVRILGVLALPQDEGAIENHDANYAQHRDKMQTYLLNRSEVVYDILLGGLQEARKAALHDGSTLVRQRAMWSLANFLEALNRNALGARSESENLLWLRCAKLSLSAASDIEGIAISAYRAFGVLLAIFGGATSAGRAVVLGEEHEELCLAMVALLCQVLETSSKPPKSRWNAASALERAVSSEGVMRLLGGVGDRAAVLDRIVGVLCAGLGAKMFKIKLSAGGALVCLGAGGDTESLKWRRRIVGETRRKRIYDAVGRARELLRSELDAAPRKQVVLYADELHALLSRLEACWS